MLPSPVRCGPLSPTGVMSEKSAEHPEMEIERKFLVSEVPESASAASPIPIVQGYIAVEPGGREVRLRRKGDRFFQTIKSGTGITRLETEIELTGEQFEKLWPQTDGRRIEKDRREVPHRGHVIELDVFGGALDGLVIAEVEFGSLEDSRAFEPPDWLGEEVTEEAGYHNRNLALHGRPPRTA